MRKVTIPAILIVLIVVVILLYIKYNAVSQQEITATKQLLTVSGQTEVEVDNSLKMLEAKSKSDFLREIFILLFGVSVGAIPTYFIFWQQQKNQNKEKEIEIISETLRYLFKINEDLNNLRADKKLLEESREKFPDKTSQLEKQMYIRFKNNIEKGFFPELMFHSFQLKRLSDQSFWKDFEILMNTYKPLVKMLTDQKDEKEYLEPERKYNNTIKTFLNKCIRKTKI